MYIIFSKNSVRLDKDGILFRKDNWDDFGYKTTFQVYTNTYFESSQYIGSVSIGVTDPVVYNTFTWLANNGYIDKRLSSFPKELFSLGAEVEYYEALIQKYSGSHEMPLLLKSFNDLANDEKIFNLVKESEVFDVSFLRHSPANSIQQYRRVINGGSKFVNFNWLITYESDANEKPKSIFINNELQSVLPTNLNAFIGANGTGKTSLLKDIAIASNSFGNFVSSTFLKKFRLKITDSPFGSDDPNRIQGITNLVYVSFSSFDVFNKDFSKTFASNPNFQFLSNREFSFLKPNKDSDTEKLHQLMNKIVDPHKFSDHIEEVFNEIRETDSSRRLLAQVLKHFKWDTLFEQLAVAINNGSTMFDSEKKIVFSTMSSGQKMIVAILFSLVHKARENSLFLIDEPELYLHPPYVLSLVLAINEILHSTNSAAIMTTHSPIVLQEIPKDHVFKILDFVDDKSIVHPTLESFGSNLSEINDEIFGVNVRDTGFYSILKELATENKIEQLDNNMLGTDAKLYVNIIRNNENV
ncbi:AAA family ATPase [Leuconostoc mesenteroides]|uniref:AAA family ATPase n=1 Tax=Leuconostoc mesenteroides TaxID=1245 RepID=UPI00235FD87E|nr:AAA family ATPase [Leuconostoc mesenteroides]